jgi:hypothetical protein
MSFFDDASLVMIPSGYKDQKVYSVKPTDGTGDLTFSRASDATRVASNGLIEKVRTNLILQSNTFSTTWSNVGSSEVSGQAGYDGTNNAWSLVEDSSTGTHTLVQIPSTFGLVTLSVYAKAGTRNWVFLRGVQGGLNVRAWFNLSTGTIGTVEANGTAKIESVGNGWYRCSLTVANFESGFEAYVAISSADTIASYTGNGTGNILIQNFQYEIGDIATAYIPTTTAAVSVGPVSGLPRLDYLGSTCPRLNLEPQRTNLATFSESFDNAAWTKETGNSVTANTTASPDGYVNADTISATAGNAININQAHTSASSSAHTFSTFLKKNNVAEVQIYIFSAGFISRATVNLDNGTITNVNGSGATITNYGNGWYRCSIQGVVNSGDGFTIGYLTSSTTGTRNVYSYGAQLEVGAYATSYIPTLNSATTRVADAASKTGISSLIGQTEGTIFVDFVMQNNSTDMVPFDISGSDGKLIWIRNAGAQFYGNGTSLIASIETSAKTQGTRYKVAFVYGQNDFRLYRNGSLIGTDTSGTFTGTFSDIALNSVINQANGFNQILLFKTKLTNDQLAELTTL